MTAMKRLAVVLAVILVLAGCGGGSKAPATAKTVTIHGTLTITSTGDFSWDLAPDGKTGICHGGSRGFDDIQSGAQVTVTNQAGTTIALGTLDGNATATFDGSGSDATGTSCKFTFSIPKVPTASFYGLEVVHRGVVKFTPAQVAGVVALTLG